MPHRALQGLEIEEKHVKMRNINTECGKINQVNFFVHELKQEKYAVFIIFSLKVSPLTFNQWRI